MTLGIMTVIIMTLSIMTLNIIVLSILALCSTKLSKLTLDYNCRLYCTMAFVMISLVSLC
jgi:hypothetical protein